MTTAAATPQRLVMGNTQGSSLGALRWLSPVLIGLCALTADDIAAARRAIGLTASRR